MIFSTSGNMYEVSLDETEELFGAFLSGARGGLVCVLSVHTLSEKARTAMENSAAALGYGRAACTFTVLETDGAQLDAQALFLLVEGLDPRCLVAADAAAADALAAAYRCSVPTGKPSRLLGRTVVAFESFESMLADSQDKQVAWALLKMLPKHGEH